MKAMQADGWSLGGGNEQMLSRFRDESSISAYARSAWQLWWSMESCQEQQIKP